MDASYYTALSRAHLVAALDPIAHNNPPWRNWAKTFACAPLALFCPTTTHHCRLALELARRDARVLRAVGVGHSPSDIACTKDYMISMVGVEGLLDVSTDPVQPHATLRAGTALTAVHALLAPHGLAMRNLGSISDQTLAGIVTTSTHGSGLGFGVMSTHVLSLTLLTPDNRVVTCSRGVRRHDNAGEWLFPPAHVPLFEATICGLGATGLLLSITLELEPRFMLRDVHSVIGWREWVEGLDDYEELCEEPSANGLVANASNPAAPKKTRRIQGLKSRAQHVRFWWFPALGKVRCTFASRVRDAVIESPTPTTWSTPLASFEYYVTQCRDAAWDLFAFHFVQTLLLLTRFGRRVRRPEIDSPPLPLWTWTYAYLWTWTWIRYLASIPLAWVLRDANVWAARGACWAGGEGAPLPGPFYEEEGGYSSSTSSSTSTNSYSSATISEKPAEMRETAPTKKEKEPGVTVDESWKVFNIECRYPQHTTEWALPAPRARACLEALGAWLEGEQAGAEGERPHFPIEVRFSAGDDLWLSPSQGGETCWIGVVQYKPYNLPTRYRALFAEFERILAMHGGRPHWAKAHHLDARATRALYPDFGKFLKVVREVDPTGIFRNEYIERHLMGGGGDGREYKERKLPAGERGEGFSELFVGSAASTSPSTAATVEDEDEEEVEAEPREAKSIPRRWWAWSAPTPTPATRADWRSDWRLPPPEGEVRRRVERRRSLERGMDEEMRVASVSRGVEGAEEVKKTRWESSLGSGSESEESDREHELDSDSDATLAGSFADMRASSGSPDGSKPRISLHNDNNARVKGELRAAGDAEKHPARTELARPPN